MQSFQEIISNETRTIIIETLQINGLIIRGGNSEATLVEICLCMPPEEDIPSMDAEEVERPRPQASSFSNPSSFSQGSKNLIDIDMD